MGAANLPLAGPLEERPPTPGPFCFKAQLEYCRLVIAMPINRVAGWEPTE